MCTCKRLVEWYSGPENLIFAMLRRHSVPIAVLIITILVVASFFLLSSDLLLRSPSSSLDAPIVTSPTPTATPSPEVSPAPSQSPPPSPSSQSVAWPCSNQTPPYTMAQALAFSSVDDAEGDTFTDTGAPSNGPGYIDIVYAEIIQIDSTRLQLSMKLAENIPNPHSQAYCWYLDTDMNRTTGVGWSVNAEGRARHEVYQNDLGVDYVIFVGVPDMYVKVGEVVPMASIGRHDPSESHSIPWSRVTVSGNTISVIILLSDIGTPPSFYWVAGSGNATLYDKAPNSGHMTLTIA